MRTIGILVSVLTVYCAIMLLAAWSLTAFNRYDGAAGGSASTTRAVVSATMLSRSRPTTRWRRSARGNDAMQHYDGAEDWDGDGAGPSTDRHAEARPKTYDVMNCFVGYAAMKDTRL